MHYIMLQAKVGGKKKNYTCFKQKTLVLGYFISTTTIVILEIQKLWPYRHAGREQLSKTDKSWQVNSFNASICAESLISCVLVRDLQGVNLSVGQQSRYQR